MNGITPAFPKHLEESSATPTGAAQGAPAQDDDTGEVQQKRARVISEATDSEVTDSEETDDEGAVAKRMEKAAEKIDKACQATVETMLNRIEDSSSVVGVKGSLKGRVGSVRVWSNRDEGSDEEEETAAAAGGAAASMSDAAPVVRSLDGILSHCLNGAQKEGFLTKLVLESAAMRKAVGPAHPSACSLDDLLSCLNGDDQELLLVALLEVSDQWDGCDISDFATEVEVRLGALASADKENRKGEETAAASGGAAASTSEAAGSAAPAAPKLDDILSRLSEAQREELLATLPLESEMPNGGDLSGLLGAAAAQPGPTRSGPGAASQDRPLVSIVESIVAAVAAQVKPNEELDRVVLDLGNFWVDDFSSESSATNRDEEEKS